jgi:hypothetical protein
MRVYGPQHQPLVPKLVAYPAASNTGNPALFVGTQDYGDFAAGLTFTLLNSSSNKQLLLGAAENAGDSSYNSFRYIVGTGVDVPHIGAVSNDLGAERHINLGDLTSNVGVGYDVLGAMQGDITAKLHVRSPSGGAGYQVDDSGGAPIFRVDDDGSIHVRSGVTLTDDL